jgi:transposase InsO family protein
MSERSAFCLEVALDEHSFVSLCRKYGIARKTGYKWLARFEEEGEEGLQERSRRPHTSPKRVDAAVEQKVLEVREANPAWGGRKIAWTLRRQGLIAVPAPSTITEILRRHNQLNPEESVKHKPYQRFEMEEPNQRWQMDFKGHFTLADGKNCYPLTVLDGHSRFLLGLQACNRESHENVQRTLTTLFRTYGLPERILTDHGPPWGFGPGLSSSPARGHHTRLTVSLLRLDIAVTHGRIRHPQTQGKDERLHRTLLDELISRRSLADLADSQAAFDAWRHRYNHERPHEALQDDDNQMDVPAAHYAASVRPFPETLPPIVYDEGACVRKVDIRGRLYFHSRRWRVGRAFYGQLVAIQPTDTDGCFTVYFGRQPIGHIDLNTLVSMPP